MSLKLVFTAIFSRHVLLGHTLLSNGDHNSDIHMPLLDNLRKVPCTNKPLRM